MFGDIHGRMDLFTLAIEAVRKHVSGRLGKLVFLGDYVDRGPDSRQIVEILMRAEARTHAVCLKGNHEEMMVAAVRSGDLDFWLRNGGKATLASYGGELNDIPNEHIQWLEGLRFAVSDQHRIYVHAGLMPGVPLAKQAEENCLWIRERFLKADRAKDFPDRKHVVHGHSPVWEGKPEPSTPELLPHRTNLDTAAYATGILTVGVFDRDQPGGPIDVLAVKQP